MARTHLGQLDASVAVLAARQARAGTASGAGNQAVAQPPHEYARHLWVDLAAGVGTGDEAGTLYEPLRSLEAAIARIGAPTSKEDFEAPWYIHVHDGVGSAVQDRAGLEMPCRRLVFFAAGAQLPQLNMIVLDDYMFGSVLPASITVIGAPGTGWDTATDVAKALHSGMARVGNNADGTHRVIGGVKEGAAEVVPGDGGFAATRKFEVVLENVWLQGQIRWLSGGVDDVTGGEATLLMRNCHWQAPQLFGHTGGPPSLPVSDDGTRRTWILRLDGCTLLGPGQICARAIPRVNNCVFAQGIAVSAHKRLVNGVDVNAGPGFTACNLGDTVFWGNTNAVDGEDPGVYTLDPTTLQSLVMGGADLNTNVDGKCFHLPGATVQRELLYFNADTHPTGIALGSEWFQYDMGTGTPVESAAGIAPPHILQAVAPFSLLRSITVLTSGTPDVSERLDLSFITDEADTQLYIASGDAFEIPMVSGVPRRDVMWRANGGAVALGLLGGPLTSGADAMYVWLEFITFDNPRLPD